MKITLSAAIAASTLVSGVAVAETWDMPVAYPAANYHTENAQEFADAVNHAPAENWKL